MIKKPFLLLIRLYQRTLSPDHGWLRVFYPNGCCIYQPTCSQYTYEAIEKYGIVKGMWMGSGRILRCNPRRAPGLDPVK